jgi:CheY-like chemotaxis protein
MNRLPSATKRIVIVGEDPETSDGLTLVLEAAGHVVSTARNGAEALQEIRTCRPDLILIDLVPPTNDSWTFRVRQLRDPELADIPIVVLADCREATERENARFERTLPGHDVLDFVGDVLQLLDEGAAA